MMHGALTIILCAAVLAQAPSPNPPEPLEPVMRARLIRHGIRVTDGDTRFAHIESRNISDEDLRDLQRIAALKQITMTNPEPKCLSKIRQLTSVHALELNGDSVTDLALRELGDMSHLHDLFLYNTKVTPKGLIRLSRQFPGLRCLVIENPDQHYADVVHLSRFKNLHTLVVRGASVDTTREVMGARLRGLAICEIEAFPARKKSDALEP